MRILALAAGLLFAALPSRAVPAFTLESGVRLSTAVPQQVVVSTGGWRMYFIRGGFEVRTATSSDGLNWTEEDGVRLSTGSLTDPDSGALLGLTVFPVSAGGYRMIYTARNAVGSAFSVLSATSTDGMVWGKEAGARLVVGTGSTYVASPRALMAGDAGRMYFVRSAAGNTPSATFVASAVSTDAGATWTEEGTVLSTATAEIAVSTLTDGRVRLLYTSLRSGTTVSVSIGSALSSNGLSFADEGVVFSTDVATGELNGPVLVRSSETFRWRLFTGFTAVGTTHPVVVSALTLAPSIDSFTPSSTLNTVSSITFTLKGEVFASTPTVSIVQGATTVNAASVALTNDDTLTGEIGVSGIARGTWQVVVTNPDGASDSLAGGLVVDIPGGTVEVTDNLFRPRLGQSASIAITIFDGGNVSVKLYTTGGELVKTIFSGPMGTGTTTVTWNGSTSAGNTVASGVYLLHVSGPKLNATEKIVVIK